MRKFTIFISLIILSLSVFSQNLNYKEKAIEPKANYFDIVASARANLSQLDMRILANKKAQKHFERWAYFWKDRVYADGTFPPADLGYFNAGILDSKGKIVRQTSSMKEGTNGVWVNIGAHTVPQHNGYPNYPQMGRLNCLLRFPSPEGMDHDVLFVGAPSGGIWKSSDGGTSWTPILDNVAGIGITDIQSADTSYSLHTVIYASTGDYDGLNIKSIGVLKSTDGGNTFFSTNLSFSLSQRGITSNLLVLSNDTVIVGTSNDIYRTTDGGTTWQSTLYDSRPVEYGRFVKSDNDTIACMNVAGEVYTSSDKGNSWHKIRDGSDRPGNKLALFFKGGTLFMEDKNGQISYYDSAGWKEIGNPVPAYDPQYGYDQTLLIENNMIISGAVDGFHSTDSGSTWYKSLNGYWQSDADSGSYIHPDFHAMGKLDNDTSTYKYWVCTDGGLNYVEYKKEGDFKPVVTYKSDKCIVTQLYSAAITPNSTTGNMLQGNQDNDGFSREMFDGEMQWIAAAAGDGTATAIDYTDPKIRYLGCQNGVLNIAINGFSGNYMGDVQLKIPGANFVWPLEMNTINPSKLYAGGDDVYLLNADSGSMTALKAGTGTVSFISTHNNAVFAIGDSAVRKSLDGGQTWSSLNQASTDPSATINSIDFVATHPDTVYATVKSYISDQKVFKSTDGGLTWNNISAGLPNILMKKVLVAQNNYQEILYVATELGVYYKIGDMQWARLGDNSLPNVIVNDLDINYTENALVAATFGRGLWQFDISDQVGINENEFAENQKPVIFPNPVTDGRIHINLPQFNSQNRYYYVIYNIVGGIMKQGELTNKNTELDLTNVSNGIYMMKISSDKNKSFVQKIIKN